MENLFQIFLISIIQGITEFVPVSSSAHINLLSKITNFKELKFMNFFYASLLSTSQNF